ncbi:MAG: FixH family protein [Ferrovibrio sp.]|uniref:FixH family protein n=1 Tax=Ferrovibrio sp. TaxID=1917215 RepID=UPI00260E19A1|nr:FixH family protein [Ferrovibrio sp.]MCW0233008.1 FixH family protein [Ferrovibrio sp.]
MQFISVLRQRWIPALFVLGFLVVIGVNAVLIVAASKTFSGLVVANPYKKGVEYSANQQDIAAQRQLNWQHRITVKPRPDGALGLQVYWTDAAGLALGGMTVTASLERPVEKLETIDVVLTDLGGGAYAAILQLPRPGIWDMHVRAERSGRHVVAADRIRVP